MEFFKVRDYFQDRQHGKLAFVYDGVGYTVVKEGDRFELRNTCCWDLLYATKSLADLGLKFPFVR